MFIVDNSISGWTGLRYLEEWSSIAKSIDVATGYFEIGALLALDCKWQEFEKIRILIGGEFTHRSQKVILEATRMRSLKKLENSINSEKNTNPFLHGVPAILDALRSGKIECRVYDRAKFHAKAYIAHSNTETVGTSALVGSSNFTRPGLTNNIELNVQVHDEEKVVQLQNWFEEHWENSSEIKEDVVETIWRHTKQYSPFLIYAKALQQIFQKYQLTATEWDEQRSQIFPQLDSYQKEAYWALMKISHQHGGAFLCDGVGLGKTFVGLMLIERLILHEGKRIALFAPKATKEGVWEPHLRRWLPHIGGVGGGADFSNLAVFSHTDLSRKGDFPERFKRVAELADVIIIDEAHHFRNPGRQGDNNKGIEPSRYYRLYNLLAIEKRPKTVFMLTATPINNRLSDFRHLIELFTHRDEKFFARTLGINGLTAHFNKMEKMLRDRVGYDVCDTSEYMDDVQNVLINDEIFQQLVVQRSRAYARESQVREHGKTTLFPKREDPEVAAYSIRKTYGRMLNLVEKAFKNKNPLFTLPMYYPLHWYKGDRTDVDAFEENRQKQVVGLIRTNFLKRFESSVLAFELSCDRLLKKLLDFLKDHSETIDEKNRLNRWIAQNADVLEYIKVRKLDVWSEIDDEEEFVEDADDEDIVPSEMHDTIVLDRNKFNVEDMISETFLDLNQIVKFLDEARRFESKHDDKLQILIRLLKSKPLHDQKVLIFTEFADTARYLKRQLEDAGIDGVEQVDSATKENRGSVIQRFAPYYNELSSPKLEALCKPEIRVLISTDVLSEGLNLQDASRIINYDIHWNPVRLMQRIGRVDRRINPETEKKLLADHPEAITSRNKVWYWNFLPPEELNQILTLYTRVSQKTLLISEALGIEGKKLLTPEDDYNALKEFNHAYEGSRTPVEDIHLEYQKLLETDLELAERLSELPSGIFSGRERQVGGVVGIFFCYALPALDKDKDEFTEEAGITRWYLYDLEHSSIVEDPGYIVSRIRSSPKTLRNCTMEERTLLEVRKQIERYIRNGYLKSVHAPTYAKPRLCCWMEINEV